MEILQGNRVGLEPRRTDMATHFILWNTDFFAVTQFVMSFDTLVKNKAYSVV